MLKYTAIIAAVMAIPAIAAATPYDGVYRQTANAECGLVGADGAALEIRDGIFFGVEMQCRMTNPVNVIDMDATLYNMQCSGEGQYWDERAMMMKARDSTDLIMIWDGYAFRYSRCPDS